MATGFCKNNFIVIIDAKRRIAALFARSDMKAGKRRMGCSRYWNPHDINILIKDWPTKSQSQIGAELHRTRSAVAGKANRLKAAGLLPNGVAKHYADKPHQARPARPAPRLKPVMLKTVQRILMEQGPAPLNGNAKPCTLLELTDSHCHWPIGDPKQPNFYFCGDAKQWDVPYCAHHIRVAYSRP